MATNLGYSNGARSRMTTLAPGIDKNGFDRGLKDGFALPNAAQFIALSHGAQYTYWHDRWDESRRHDRLNSLAIARDPFIQSLVQERAHACSTLNWHIEVDNEKDPRQKSLKDGLTRVLRTTPYLTKHHTQILEEGIFIGRTASQHINEWRMIDLPAVNHQAQTGTAPAAITVRDVPRRCMVVKDHEPINGDSIGHKLDGTPYILGNVSELKKLPNAETTLTTAGGLGLVLRGSWRERFVLFSHKHKAADFWDWEKAESKFGIGIRDVIYWLWWLKNEYLEWVTTFVERFGLGLRLWYYDPNNINSLAEAQARAKAADRKVDIFVPASIGKDGKVRDGGVEVIDSPLGGAEVVLSLVRYFDEKMERYIVGQSMSGGNDSEGSLGGTGRANFARDTKHQLVKYDAENLGDCYTADWVNPVQYWTFPECRSIPARFRFNVPDPESQEKLEGVSKFVGQMGFKEDEVRELIGMSTPAPGDATVGGKQALGAPMGAPSGDEEPESKGESSPFGKDEEDGGEGLDESQVEQAIRQNNGNLTAVGPSLGVTRQAVQQFIGSRPQLKQLADSLRMERDGEPIRYEEEEPRAERYKGTGHALAQAFADLWNKRGEDIPEPHLEAAGHVLSGDDWVLHWNLQDGRWEVHHADDGQWAESEKEPPQEEEPIQHARHEGRAPRGGVHINGKFYKGGQFIPRQFTVTGSTPGVSALSDRPKEVKPEAQESSGNWLDKAKSWELGKRGAVKEGKDLPPVKSGKTEASAKPATAGAAAPSDKPKEAGGRATAVRDAVTNLAAPGKRAKIADVRDALAKAGITDRKEQDEAIIDAARKGIIAATGRETSAGVTKRDMDATLRNPAFDGDIAHLSVKPDASGDGAGKPKEEAPKPEAKPASALDRMRAKQQEQVAPKAKAQPAQEPQKRSDLAPEVEQSAEEEKAARAKIENKEPDVEAPLQPAPDKEKIRRTAQEQSAEGKAKGHETERDAKIRKLMERRKALEAAKKGKK